MLHDITALRASFWSARRQIVTAGSHPSLATLSINEGGAPLVNRRRGNLHGASQRKSLT